jgi:antitoxin VapB
MSATNAKPKPQPTPAPKTAKLFKNGRSQAVRLPKEFRFEGKEVAIRRDPATGEVILAPVPLEPSISFDEWFALYGSIPDDVTEEEFAKLPPRPKNLTRDQLFKIIDRAHVPADFMAHRRTPIPQGSWEERFVVWDALGSPDEDELERDPTPPAERDFF